MFKTPVNILLVDDEKDFVEMLSLRLKEFGKKVTPAYSGAECLEKLKANNIDVIILDIKMPGMDGMETLKEIKSRFPLVEVIMLTGHGSIETAVDGMKIGAFDYILKPANLEDLLEKISEAKKNKEAQEERIRKAENHALLMESRKGGRSPFPG
jgi:DNA-binding NtrC family response regulator